MTTLANTSILNMSKFIQVFTLLVAVTATVALPLNNENDHEQDRRLSERMKNMIMSVTSTTRGQEPSTEGVHITGNSGGTADYNSEISTTTPADYNSEISTTAEGPSTVCLLSSSQVQDIQSTDPSLFYMVVDNRVVTDQSLFELYVRLVGIVSETAATNHHITNIWLSRAPCKPCIEILEYAFAGANIKPTIHIESWKINNHQPTTYGTVLQSIGCLSKLNSQGYRIAAWDWDMFHKATDSTSCNYYANNLQLDSVYATEKKTLIKSLPFITGFDAFCQHS